MGSKTGLELIIEQTAKEYNLNPKLVLAVCTIESSMNTWASRYEPQWRWWYFPKKFANLVRITDRTERIQQATSWGLMQVMGTVARELGWKEDLPKLCKPENGLKMGCLKLRKLLTKYRSLPEALSSYNSGRPDSKIGKQYAEKVLTEFSRLTEKK